MKATIRKKMLAFRAQLSAQEVQIKSEQITQFVKPYLHACVGSYVAIDHEVDPIACKSEVNAYPKIYADNTIRFFKVDEHTKYEKNKYGILEPVDGFEVDPSEIAVLLIPLVAFDEELHRLGHGKGYYDRYLKNYKGIRIGLAYECQKVASIPCEEHDESLDMIVTEMKIYHRKDN
ncbi:MAG: 5-formyltetrahydrofolate cyclo-ligase [Longicatena sp.]